MVRCVWIYLASHFVTGNLVFDLKIRVLIHKRLLCLRHCILPLLDLLQHHDELGDVAASRRLRIVRERLIHHQRELRELTTVLTREPLIFNAFVYGPLHFEFNFVNIFEM